MRRSKSVWNRYPGDALQHRHHLIMERRSFFRSLLGTAVAGATVAAAKPTVAPEKRGTAKVTPYTGWKCAECGNAMWNSRNHTMRCSNADCPNRDVPFRIPQFDAVKADSDEEELLRHAFIILGVIIPGQCVSAADMKLGSEVIKRLLEKIDAHKSENPEESYPGMYFPTPAHDISPHDLAVELAPYYQIS